MAKKAKKKYSDEFKQKWVDEMGKRSTQIPQIAKEAGVPATILYRWRKEAGGGYIKSYKKPADKSTTHDAIIYLRYARDAMNKELREGKIKKLSKSNLLSLLALDVLSGED